MTDDDQRDEAVPGNPPPADARRPDGDCPREARAVEALHAATRRLMTAASHEGVMQVASEAATEVLGFAGTGVRRYDESDHVLRQVSLGGTVGDVDLRPAYDVETTPHGRAFRTGETVVCDVGADDPYDRDPFTQTMYVPIGDHGVLSAGKLDEPFTEHDRRLAEILTANTRVALDRVDTEAQLRAERERLDRFAGIVAHDLRNPLSVAQSSLEFYEEAGDEARLHDAQDALDRMSRIVDDVLTLARQGETVDDRSLVDLALLVREAWATTTAPDVSLAVDADATIEADRERLRRLFENLFSNAVEHGSTSPPSQTREDALAHASDGLTTVRVGLLDADACADGDATGFYVEDDGRGIPPADRDSVFDAGYTTSTDGTGFGLAIVAEIATAHGFDVGVCESAEGGARFEFSNVPVRSPDHETT
jgi:signal transduction histidine kinase